MQEAILYDILSDGKVRCNICQRHCTISAGTTGYCWSRINQGGRLYTLIYAQVSSISINPIEKKPVFHFFPGSQWLSLGSFGCNFRCPGCQNWEIAHSSWNSSRGKENLITPEELVHMAKKHGCLGISWTFNEPAIWLEYTLEGARLAKNQGLFTNYVTNGFITIEALDAIGPYLDVFRVDIKGFSPEAYQKIANVKDFHGILDVTKRAKHRWNMHVEVVSNIIPGINDKDEELSGIASWIREELGEDTPWHVTRFYPHLDLSHLSPTPISTLERGRKIGLDRGLFYVYLGNVPGHAGENT